MFVRLCLSLFFVMLSGCWSRSDTANPRAEAAPATQQAVRSLKVTSAPLPMRTAKQTRLPQRGSNTPQRGATGTRTQVRQLPARPTKTAALDQAKPRGPPTQQLQNVKVLAYERVVHEGSIDLRPTIARILAGKKHSHHNDGSMFKNRERRLPKRHWGYYREFVHPSPGIRGAGPQRVIRGDDGDWYYTPDHYQTFIPLQ